MPSATHSVHASTPSVHANNEEWSQVVEFLPLVRSIAVRTARRYPSSLEAEDLVNIGTIALLGALDRFDPERGVPLRAFAAVRIRGAMVDALRQNDWVPREVRRRGSALSEARRSLTHRLGRAPSRTELAEALSRTPEELDGMISGSATRSIVSLDAPVNSESDTCWADLVALESNNSPADATIAREEQEALTDALEALAEDERFVVSMYYERGLRYREIGAMMGICESRVCQLRTLAVDRLRRRINTRAGSRRLANVA